MSISVLVPAAGASARMGGDIRKPFLHLGGEPILLRTVKRLRACEDVSEIILAVHPDDLSHVRDEAWETFAAAGVTLAVEGGGCRAISVWHAFEASDPKADLVAIHDAVRPFLDGEMLSLLWKTARDKGAAVPAVPVSDTIKRIEGDRVTETVRRGGLMQVQTPQVFRREVYLAACEFAFATGGLSESVTDDASLVEASGREVAVVYSNETNLKITTRRDLRRAEAYLAAGLVR